MTTLKLSSMACLAILFTGCRPSPPEIVAVAPEPEEPAGEALEPPVSAAEESAAAMVRKLKTIIIPEIEFAYTPFEDAIVFLAKRSRELDPGGEGVDFIFAKELGPEQRSVQVTMKLTGAPLSEALAYTADLAGAKMTLEEHAVVLSVGTGNPLENALLFVEPKEADAFREKMKTLIVPSIEFQETPLFDALGFLRNRALELDVDTPEGRRGVDLVLAIPPESGINPEKLTVSLKLSEVSLEAGFRHTAEQAGLEYRVEGIYVVISAPKAP